jgi:hypothetical protein
MASDRRDVLLRGLVPHPRRLVATRGTRVNKSKVGERSVPIENFRKSVTTGGAVQGTRCPRPYTAQNITVTPPQPSNPCALSTLKR